MAGDHVTMGELTDTQAFTFAVVPEPATVAFGTGALALLLVALHRWLKRVRAG